MLHLECVVCGLWCVVCGVWCVVCGVWCVMCGEMPHLEQDGVRWVGDVVPGVAMGVDGAWKVDG